MLTALWQNMYYVICINGGGFFIQERFEQQPFSGSSAPPLSPQKTDHPAKLSKEDKSSFAGYYTPIHHYGSGGGYVTTSPEYFRHQEPIQDFHFYRGRLGDEITWRYEASLITHEYALVSGVFWFDYQVQVQMMITTTETPPGQGLRRKKRYQATKSQTTERAAFNITTGKIQVRRTWCHFNNYMAITNQFGDWLCNLPKGTKTWKTVHLNNVWLSDLGLAFRKLLKLYFYIWIMFGFQIFIEPIMCHHPKVVPRQATKATKKNVPKRRIQFEETANCI